METISAADFAKRYGKDAITQFSVSAPAAEKPLSQRLATVGNEAASRISTALNDGGSNSEIPRRAVDATAAAFSVAPKAAAELLPQPVRDAGAEAGSAIGKGFTSLTDALSNIPGLAELVYSHPKISKAIEDAVGVGAGAGEIASNILAVDTGGVKLPTAAAETVGKTTASAVENIVKSPEAIKNVRLALTELDPQAETILKQSTLPEFEHYYEAATKAATDPRVPTPMELAGDQAGKALDQIQRKLQGIGSAKRTVLAKAAIGLKPVGNIALKFRQELGNALNAGVAVKGDASLMQTLLTGAERLGSNPSAAQVDHFIDSAQDILYTAGRDLTVPVTTGGVARVRAIVGRLNESLKSKLPESYRNVNGQFHDLVGVRDELNTKLGKEGERAGALMKRVFSPSDANTKTLFNRVHKETGIDLVKEATLAKFVMESVGDVRQKSLLKQLDLATKDLSELDLTKPGTWLSFLRSKAELPAPDAARETIKKSSSGKSPSQHL